MHSGRSWLEGTMEVVARVAPRPSTPQPTFASRGSFSAPNSPMRSSYPAISRLPSQDSLDRSIHNESGHGKSTEQIIRDLKHSNAALSAKTAEMEANFMNQLNKLTLSFQEKQKVLEESIKRKDGQIASMESRCVSTENRIRERDAQLAKLKEENAFQRHSISDLKNQLYQLQHDIEEAEYDKQDEVGKWALEQKDMSRELETLKKKAEEGQKLREEVETLRAELSKAKVFETADRDMVDLHESWRQIEEYQDELLDSKNRLLETQSALTALEEESKRISRDRSQEVERLKRAHAESAATWKRKESDLLAKISTLHSSQDVKDLQAKINERDETIASLKSETEKYSNQLKQLTKDIAKIRSEADTREQYRMDEAEDLRVLHDAQEEEITRLRKEVEDALREIEMRDQELEEKERTLRQIRTQPSETREPNEAASKAEELVVELKSQLQKSHDIIVKLREEMSHRSAEHEKLVSSLRTDIEKLNAQRDEAESKLQSVKEERDQAPRNTVDDKTAATNGDDKRFQVRLEEVFASATRERCELEQSFVAKIAAIEASNQEIVDAMTKELQTKDGILLELHKKAEEMGKIESELDSLKAIKSNDEEQIKLLQEKLQELEIQVRSARNNALEESQQEIQSLKETIKALEAKNQSSVKAKRQLREAQIALVALDDDKKKQVAKFREQIASLKKEKEETENELRAQILAIDNEVSGLKHASSTDNASIVAELVAELDALRNERHDRKDNSQDDSFLDELLVSRENEKRLTEDLEATKKQMEAKELELQEKLNDRDTTISALVKSSIAQEQKLMTLKSEISSLRLELDRIGGDEVELEAVRAARAADHKEELEELRSALDDYKQVEARLSREIALLKKERDSAEMELKRLKEMSNKRFGNGVHGHDFQREIDALNTESDERLRERDAAIANLVKQSVAQEEQVAKFQSQVAALTKELEGLRKENELLEKRGRSRGNGPTWDEVRKLRKESEIFAGQVIEQDEEIEGLKAELKKRDDQVVSLSTDLAALRKKTNSIDRDLQAELHELQEANESKRNELRELRRQLREAKASVDDVTDLRIELEQAKHALEESRKKVTSGDESLKQELEEERASKQALEKKMQQQLESVRRLRNNAVDALEAKLKERDDLIESMKASSHSHDEKIRTLQDEVDAVRGELASKTDALEGAQRLAQELLKQHEELSQMTDRMRNDVEKDTLTKEVTELRQQLESLSDHKIKIAELTEKVSKSEQARQASEKSLIDAYEKKIQVLKSNKDDTIDGLRNELAEAKEKSSDELELMKRRLAQLEMDNKDIKDELEAKLQHKNTRIQALEQTLSAQLQLVDNMRSEMDHLQGSMEHATLSRRAEIEEMQQEVIDSSSRAAKQERELTALKMQLEESKLERKAEVAKLKDIISSLEKPSPLARSVAEHQIDQRMGEVKERLEQLKWRNSSLQEENSKLRNRLEKAESEVKTSKNAKYRTATLEEQVGTLGKRVQELEMELSVAINALNDAHAAIASSPAKESSSSKPPIAPSTSRQSSNSLERPSPENINSRKTHSASPRRGIQNVGSFRFLKRRSQSRESSDDDQSKDSKLTF